MKNRIEGAMVIFFLFFMWGLLEGVGLTEAAVRGNKGNTVNKLSDVLK